MRLYDSHSSRLSTTRKPSGEEDAALYKAQPAGQVKGGACRKVHLLWRLPILVTSYKGLYHDVWLEFGGMFCEPVYAVPV